MRDKSFRYKRVSLCLFLIQDCQSGHTFSFNNPSLREKHTSASLIDLGHQSNVLETGENTPRTIQVRVRFVVLVNPEIQHSKIVLDTGEITSVLGLFKVVTSGCVFD